MLAVVSSATLFGLEGRVIRVEVDVAPGLPGFTIVGLADTALQEARERVRGALRNAGYVHPPRRITVNLAPADLRKAGASLDLAIAIGILLGSEQVTPSSRRIGFLGELSLGGEVRAVPGILPMVAALARRGVRTVAVAGGRSPRRGWSAASRCSGSRRSRRPSSWSGHRGPGRDGRRSDASASSGRGVRRRRAGARAGTPDRRRTQLPGSRRGPRPGRGTASPRDRPGRRARAAAGRAARVGKTLARADGPGSAAAARRRGGPRGDRRRLGGRRGTAARPVRRPPFRAPHHTISYAGMVGGGPRLSPGEVTLADHGVLFLDELPEFDRDVLEALRQPLEEGRIAVVRAGRAATFPARFQLIAAMNPCPCGHAGSTDRPCRCPPLVAERYQRRVSGPLRDRIDLWIDMPRVRPGAHRRAGSRGIGRRGAADRRGAVDGAARDRRAARGRLTGRALRAACALDGRPGAPLSAWPSWSGRAGEAPNASCGSRARSPTWPGAEVGGGASRRGRLVPARGPQLRPPGRVTCSSSGCRDAGRRRSRARLRRSIRARRGHVGCAGPVLGADRRGTRCMGGAGGRCRLGPAGFPTLLGRLGSARATLYERPRRAASGAWSPRQDDQPATGRP